MARTGCIKISDFDVSNLARYSAVLYIIAQSTVRFSLDVSQLFNLLSILSMLIDYAIFVMNHRFGYKVNMVF